MVAACEPSRGNSVARNRVSSRVLYVGIGIFNLRWTLFSLAASFTLAFFWPVQWSLKCWSGRRPWISLMAYHDNLSGYRCIHRFRNNWVCVAPRSLYG